MSLTARHDFKRKLSRHKLTVFTIDLQVKSASSCCNMQLGLFANWFGTSLESFRDVKDLPQISYSLSQEYSVYATSMNSSTAKQSDPHKIGITRHSLDATQ